MVYNKLGDCLGELHQQKKKFASWTKSIAEKYPKQRVGFAIQSNGVVQIVDSEAALLSLQNPSAKGELVIKVALPKAQRKVGEAWKCA